jgi:hypothetical protein
MNILNPALKNYISTENMLEVASPLRSVSDGLRYEN